MDTPPSLKHWSQYLKLVAATRLRRCWPFSANSAARTNGAVFMRAACERFCLSIFFYSYSAGGSLRWDNTAKSILPLIFCRQFCQSINASFACIPSETWARLAALAEINFPRWRGGHFLCRSCTGRRVLSLIQPLNLLRGFVSFDSHQQRPPRHSEGTLKHASP